MRDQAKAVGAKVLHVTPPVFDPCRSSARRYRPGSPNTASPTRDTTRCLSDTRTGSSHKGAAGWDVVDVHGPMKRFLSEHRHRDPNYRLADDGVHINNTGHWIIARQILVHWGVADLELGEPTRERR